MLTHDELLHYNKGNCCIFTASIKDGAEASEIISREGGTKAKKTPSIIVEEINGLREAYSKFKTLLEKFRTSRITYHEIAISRCTRREVPKNNYQVPNKFDF